ncbi:hypothetical protein MN116_002414 [Schistosoma mekongi]|uniref:Adenylate kinase 7 n=1 Tax=Schistosoma mekongi TaxID=38744 RepID=A0AAE1ZK54_SCHME|nr:hypothetical protein MN116_002414 [Schistosoma mekongi]
MPTITSQTFKMTETMRYKVFIANVDRYDEQYIAKFLSQLVVGKASRAEDEEAVEEENDKSPKDTRSLQTYSIYGTVGDCCSDLPGFVNIIQTDEKRQDYIEKIMECDYIIYNIKDDHSVIDDALWILDQLHNNLESFKTQKIFILISSVLTWSKSSLPDPNDPEILFTDDDYLRRKAHSNFKEHILAEKSVVQQGKTNKLKLLTYVIACGLTYGEKENVFHHFFKAAWNNEQFLQVPGDGHNIVPTIHLRDLTSILQSVMEMRPVKHYILAKDDSQNTLREIVKAISSSMTTGQIKSISKEEALFCRDITQNTIDQLLVSLRMNANYVKENFQLKWYCETGLIDNINMITKEYKLSRQLIPIRLCILGPPASGKTTLAKKLCEYYKLQHIHIKHVIDEGITNLKQRVQLAKESQNDPYQTQMTNENEHSSADDVEFLEAIQQNMIENNGRLGLEYVTTLFQEKLNSKPCQNQGYIIDGYPKSKKQAASLFSHGGDGDDEEEEGEQEENEEEEEKSETTTGDIIQSSYELFKNKYLPSEKEAGDVTKEPGLLLTQPIPMQLPKGILPAYVFELQATDSFLRDRIINMPEYKVHGTHYTESGFWRRLNEYRTNQIGVNPALSPTLNIPGTPCSEIEVEQVSTNSLSPLASASIYENSVRAYFDSKGILQIPVNIMTDESEDLEQTFKKLVYFIGPPRNYGLTDEEIEKQRLNAEKQRLEFERIEEERLKQEIETAEAERNKRIKEWQEKHEALKKEETDLLNQEAEPLRAYLKKHIMPVLTKGLTECIRKRPDDPLDFLAEYLFYNNPQVD